MLGLYARSLVFGLRKDGVVHHLTADAQQKSCTAVSTDVLDDAGDFGERAFFFLLSRLCSCCQILLQLFHFGFHRSQLLLDLASFHDVVSDLFGQRFQTGPKVLADLIDRGLRLFGDFINE